LLVLILGVVPKLKAGQAPVKEREMTKTRNRKKQTSSLQDRLAAFASGVRAKAELLPPGPEQDQLLQKLHSADTAAHIEDWANSPGLQAPK
jgi:hypothetical protein